MLFNLFICTKILGGKNTFFFLSDSMLAIFFLRIYRKGLFEKKKSPEFSGLVVLTGIEPVTHGFSVRCSTN